MTRTRGYGDWKNWFTAEDVAFFRPLLDDYVRLAGLPDDWELAATPTVPPEFASAYVRRIVDEKRHERSRAVDATHRRAARTGTHLGLRAATPVDPVTRRRARS